MVAALPCARNDTAITADNPSLTLPGKRIIVVNMNYVNDVNGALSRLCTKVDPGWAATLGITNHPQMPHIVGITAAQSGTGLAAFIFDTPYAIGMLLPMTVRIQTAQLINQAGKAVTISPATVSQAFLELSANGPLPDGSGFDLSNAQSAYAWPASVHSR